ncbi:hypothetical protein [Bradyrhizobium erythrophlei]|uniref:Uncharacterized protein n=1 Tax=Bradyrhizobium erythrophlei TaxID=1437360 RepID=A0A1M5NGK6_9BRAD|nr:hypothetical protein [Bradyrhizobium erythrophlei]SHG88359.1 hypothetical protein SAMN05443248_2978 [Bradyrhizobium erythrophlei]
MTTTAEVSIFVTIDNEVALIGAARQRYLDENPNETDEDASNIVPDGDVSAALRMLFDPGVSPDGCTILDSECEVSNG